MDNTAEFFPCHPFDFYKNSSIKFVSFTFFHHNLVTYFGLRLETLKTSSKAMKTFHQKFPFIAFFILLIPLTLLFLVEAYFSLSWRMVHDSPLLYYMGYLVSQFGAVPYRDFFDMNMPGAHWINALLGSIFGFSDAGFQRANLIILLGTMGLIFLWLRTFSIWSGLTGSILFGVFFFQYGPVMSMQREFLILPFVLLAMIAFPYSNSNSKYLRYLITGFFTGISLLIKPQGVLFLPLLITIAFINSKKNQTIKQSLIKSISIICLGFILPIIATILYFIYNQALNSFLDVAFLYWPLYSQINSHMEIASGLEEFRSHIDGLYSIGTKVLLFAPGLVGLIALYQNRNLSIREQRKTNLMAGGAFVSLIGVIFANKYWEYHWLPMFMFLILLAAAGLSNIPMSAKPHIVWSSIGSIFLVVAFVFRPPNDFWNQLQTGTVTIPQGGRVDEVANYLTINLEPGEKVQPLDWAKGAVHSMFLAKSKPATRYLYDFYFYHHVSNPEIQFIRKDLINQLVISRPKVIIQYYDGRPWVSGKDTTREFPELQQFLTDNYYVDKDKNGYRLWMRK